MKKLLFFFALSLCAAAQTIGGFVDRGVILTGDLTTPTLENHSSKTIIVAHVLQVHQSGKKQSAGAFMIPEPDGGGGGLKPGGSMVLMKNNGGTRPGITDSPAISVTLAGVIFADGEILGESDPTYPGKLEAELTAMVTAGSLAREGNWGALQKLHDLLGTEADGTPGAYGRIAAYHLVQMHNGLQKGNLAQYASRLQDLPSKLWRTQQ